MNNDTVKPIVFIEMEEVIENFIYKHGIMVDEWDGNTYFNLPQWYKRDEAGRIIEVPFNELPEQCKFVDIISNISPTKP